MNKIKDFFSQLGVNSFKSVFYFLAGLAVLVLVFQLGVFVGYKKASFSYRWGEEYHRSFNGPKGMLPRDMGPQPFFEAHGAVGRIIELTPPTLLIESPDGSEKSIEISSGTIIRRFRENVSVRDLKLEDSVVVVGAPGEEGRVQAKLIRILPLPEVR